MASKEETSPKGQRAIKTEPAKKKFNGTIKFVFYGLLTAENNSLTSEIIHIGASHFNRDGELRVPKDKHHWSYVMPEGDITWEASLHTHITKPVPDEIHMDGRKLRRVKTQKEALVDLFRYAQRVSGGKDVVLCAYDNKRRYSKILCYNILRSGALAEIDDKFLDRCYFMDALTVFQKMYPSLPYHYLPKMTRELNLTDPDHVPDAQNFAIITRWLTELIANEFKIDHEHLMLNNDVKIPVKTVLEEQRLVLEGSSAENVIDKDVDNHPA